MKTMLFSYSLIDSISIQTSPFSLTVIQSFIISVIFAWTDLDSIFIHCICSAASTPFQKNVYKQLQITFQVISSIVQIYNTTMGI